MTRTVISPVRTANSPVGTAYSLSMITEEQVLPYISVFEDSHNAILTEQDQAPMSHR